MQSISKRFEVDCIQIVENFKKENKEKTIETVKKI